jgi:hypothetical protein
VRTTFGNSSKVISSRRFVAASKISFEVCSCLASSGAWTFQRTRTHTGSGLVNRSSTGAG